MEEHSQPSHRASGLQHVALIIAIAWVIVPALFALYILISLLLNDEWLGWAEVLQRLHEGGGAAIGLATVVSSLLNGTWLGSSLAEKDDAYSWNNAFSTFAASLAIGLTYWGMFADPEFIKFAWWIIALVLGGVHLVGAAITAAISYSK